DTPELRLGAFRWLNRWLKGDNGPVVEIVREPFAPEQLKVLATPPADAINPRIQEVFIRTPDYKLVLVPDSAAPWEKMKEESKNILRTKVFRGWPDKPPPLNTKAAVDLTKDGLRLRAFDFTSEADVELRVWLLTAATVEKPELVVLTSMD